MDIKRFPLAWRWTSPSHAVLPPEVLMSMHPLEPKEATQLYRRGVQVFGREASAIEASHLSEDVERTRQWLSELAVAPDQQVCVVWDASTAISLPWKAFVTYWDDFCYPSSDDLFVLFPGQAMVLAWNHEEVFEVVQDAV